MVGHQNNLVGGTEFPEILTHASGANGVAAGEFFHERFIEAPSLLAVQEGSCDETS